MSILTHWYGCSSSSSGSSSSSERTTEVIIEDLSSVPKPKVGYGTNIII